MTDWKVGDLAVCVDAGPVRHPANKPTISLVRGEVYQVTAVVFGLLLNGEPPHRVSPLRGETGWDESRFRKVQHDKPEACETAFTVLLNRSKRKVGA